jgi:hypothetical protein
MAFEYEKYRGELLQSNGETIVMNPEFAPASGEGVQVNTSRDSETQPGLA